MTETEQEPKLASPHNDNARNLAVIAVVTVVAALTIVFWPEPEVKEAESTAQKPVVYNTGARQSGLDAPAASTPTGNAGTPTPGFVRFDQGSFAMGSPPTEADRSGDEAQHQVTISRAFEIQKYEVSQGEYAELIGKNPAKNRACGKDCPVEQVSWIEAAHYCNELSRRRKLPLCYVVLPLEVRFKDAAELACRGYRLPTEAEWEYAARAGSEAARYGPADEVSWYDNNSEVHIWPGGQKKPNAKGLFDMLGNVSEWVWDGEGAYSTEAVTDPTGASQAQNKVFRGGSFRYPASEARHAFRNGYGPANQVDFIGFRCARTL